MATALTLTLTLSIGKTTIAQHKRGHTFRMSAISLTTIGAVYLTRTAITRMNGRYQIGRISRLNTPVSEPLNICPHTPALLMQQCPPSWVDYTLWDFKNPDPGSEETLKDQTVPGFETYTPGADFTTLEEGDNRLSPRVSFIRGG